MSYGPGGQDLWLVKVGSKVNKEWSQTYGGKNLDSEYLVVQTKNSGYAITGWTTSYGAGKKLIFGS